MKKNLDDLNVTTPPENFVMPAWADGEDDGDDEEEDDADDVQYPQPPPNERPSNSRDCQREKRKMCTDDRGETR